MAGEWISVDCCLAQKPEVLEIIGETGEEPGTVVGRLVLFWAWASLNSAGGIVRGSPAILRAVAGGDEAFWRSVERVGWVTIGDGDIAIGGWEGRFSKSAKSRYLTRLRAKAQRDAEQEGEGDASKSAPERTESALERTESAPQRTVSAPDIHTDRQTNTLSVATSETRSRSGSTPKDFISWNLENGWQGISPNDLQEFADAYPAANLDQELAKATAWLKANPTKARRKNWRKFLVGWLSRCQDKGGSVRGNGARPDGSPPPPKRWLDEYKPAEYRRPRELADITGALKLRGVDD